MGNYLSTDQAWDRLDKVRALYQDASGNALTTVLGDDVDQCEGEVNGYLAGRYTVPVTDSAHQAFLRSLTLALLHELAYTRLPSGAVPDGVKARADKARETLAKLSDGTLRLAGASETSTSTTGLLAESNDPELTRDKLKNW